MYKERISNQTKVYWEQNEFGSLNELSKDELLEELEVLNENQSFRKMKYPFEKDDCVEEYLLYFQNVPFDVYVEKYLEEFDKFIEEMENECT